MLCRAIGSLDFKRCFELNCFYILSHCYGYLSAVSLWLYDILNCYWFIMFRYYQIWHRSPQHTLYLKALFKKENLPNYNKRVHYSIQTSSTVLILLLFFKKFQNPPKLLCIYVYLSVLVSHWSTFLKHFRFPFVSSDFFQLTWRNRYMLDKGHREIPPMGHKRKNW